MSRIDEFGSVTGLRVNLVTNPNESLALAVGEFTPFSTTVVTTRDTESFSVFLASK